MLLYIIGLCYRVYGLCICFKQLHTESNIGDGSQAIAFSLFIMINFLNKSTFEQFFDTNCLSEPTCNCKNCKYVGKKNKCRIFDLLDAFMIPKINFKIANKATFYFCLLKVRSVNMNCQNRSFFCLCEMFLFNIDHNSSPTQNIGLSVWE